MIFGAAPQELLRGISDGATASLVTAIWQGVILACGAALALRMLPKTPAAARFAIWFAVFLLVAGIPLRALLVHSAPGALLATHRPWLTLDPRWSEAVLALWAAASLARAVGLGVAAVRVHALWRRATPLATEHCAGPEFTCAGRPVQICTSDEVDRPSVIGFFAPRILIPAWLVDKLSPDEMQQVILHEAGHLRRADDWLNLLQKLALVLFPLNPALLWIERRLCFERELACDERVLRATGAPKAYASCLASLAQHRMTRRGIALVMGALGRESELGQRVHRILSRGEGMRPAQTRFVMAGAVVALVASAACLERSPQLVGFSSDSTLREAAFPGIPAGDRAGRPVSYQPVVFHPGSFAPHLSPVAAGSWQGAPAQGVQGSASLSGSPHRQTKIAVGRQKSSRGPRPSRAHLVHPVPSPGWVLMTSRTVWANNGARVVLTSIQAMAAGRSREAGISVRNDASPSAETLPLRYHQQVSPYAAAVPVRGGWLIIQL